MNRFLQTKYYYVDAYSGWMIVFTNNKRKARAEGVWEFGRGQVKGVREATDEEVTYYENLKGKLTAP
jgi:hypothetical protein